jgi:Flp pilus assembly secretin CpaC
MNLRIQGESVAMPQISREPLLSVMARQAMTPAVVQADAKQTSMATAARPTAIAKPIPQSRSEATDGQDAQVGVNDSASFQSESVITGVSVEHKEVCQIIQSSPKTYSIVGLSAGSTRVAIESNGPNGRQVQMRRVQVTGTQNTPQSVDSLAATLNQSIQRLYPRTKAKVLVRGDQLVIAGRVDSEDTAKKILGLARKATLVPVVDELKSN